MGKVGKDDYKFIIVIHLYPFTPFLIKGNCKGKMSYKSSSGHGVIGPITLGYVVDYLTFL